MITAELTLKRCIEEVPPFPTQTSREKDSHIGGSVPDVTRDVMCDRKEPEYLLFPRYKRRAFRKTLVMQKTPKFA